jgi:hypothetical protein
MRRKWNSSIYLGFVVALVALVSYPFFFVRFPATRDFPWVNLLLFGVAVILLAVGLRRAFGRVEQYRGKVAGPIWGLLSVAMLSLFLFLNFSFTKLKPPAQGTPQVGQKAPDFTLPDTNGNRVTLSRLWGNAASGASGSTKDQWVLLIFYRGYW